MRPHPKFQALLLACSFVKAMATRSGALCGALLAPRLKRAGGKATLYPRLRCANLGRRCKGRTPFSKVTKCHFGKWSRRIKGESPQEPYNKMQHGLTTATRITCGQARSGAVTVYMALTTSTMVSLDRGVAVTVCVPALLPFRCATCSSP